MTARGVFLRVLGVALGAAILAGALYFGFVEAPPPEIEVRKVLPDDRFPR